MSSRRVFWNEVYGAVAILVATPVGDVAGQESWTWDLAAGYARIYRADGFEVETGLSRALGRSSRIQSWLGASLGYAASGLATQPIAGLNERRSITASLLYELRFGPKRGASPFLAGSLGLVRHSTTDKPFLPDIGPFPPVAPEDYVDHGRTGWAGGVSGGLRLRLARSVAGLVRIGTVYYDVVPGAATNWAWRLLLGLSFRGPPRAA